MKRRFRIGAARLGTAVVALLVAGWTVGRATSSGRRLIANRVPESEMSDPEELGLSGQRGREASGVTADDATRTDTFPPSLTILSWNIAHGRGDVRQGWTNNWRGGSQEVRLHRLARIAQVIRESGAHIVILNEVDFDSQWSRGVDQAEFLSRAAGYPFRVEQRNYDLGLPPLRFVFGNALLTSLSVEEAGWVELPPHSWLERVVLGAKAASVARLESPLGCLAVVPVHLEVRSRKTRMKALEAFRDLRGREECPVVLAGDFNSAPSGWPGAPGGTVMDSLLDLGWISPRASSGPDSLDMTFPTSGLREARDWILVEPPLRVISVHVLQEARTLSDHAPVVAVVALEGDHGRRE